MIHQASTHGTPDNIRPSRRRFGKPRGDSHRGQRAPRRLRPVASAALLGLCGLASAVAQVPPPIERPNFLWITTEDNGPRLGCYGDALARTPNLDALASQGIAYTRAFANAPVCAPARVTLFTGRYASTLGLESMRSWYQVAEFDNYAQRLRMAGYYCSNNAKTDYNHDGFDPGYWDASSKTAHYRNRYPKQPFFHVWSGESSHEWNSWNLSGDPIRTDPAKVVVPPYLPDTPLIRRQLARGVDMIENADREVGKWLDELEAEGLADSTIIVYCGDHGGVFPRSKRYLYDTGTRVPLIIRIPEKFKHLRPGKPGSKIDRLVSFVDVAPTLLSLAGLPIPDFMQGTPFLGKQARPGAEEAYLFKGRIDNLIDLSRGLRTPRHLYIRNYMPHRPNGLYSTFEFHQASYAEWFGLFQKGALDETQAAFFQPKPPEELYDAEADPWQIRNLAAEPEHQELLGQMRARLERRIRETRDISFVSEIRREALLDVKPLRTAVDDSDIPIERVIETANLAGWADPAHLPDLIVRLGDPDPSVVYWAATGCCALGEKAAPARDALLRALKNPSWEARIPAAEALCHLGKRDTALPVLIEALKGPARVAFHAANALYAIDRLEPLGKETLNAIRPLADLPRGQLRTQPAWPGFARYYLTRDMLDYIMTKKIDIKGMGGPSENSQ